MTLHFPSRTYELNCKTEINTTAKFYTIDHGRLLGKQWQNSAPNERGQRSASLGPAQFDPCLQLSQKAIHPIELLH